MTPSFMSITNTAGDPFAALAPKGRSPMPLPAERSDLDPTERKPRRAEKSFDEQLDVTLAKERRNARKESGDPASAANVPLAITPAEKNVPQDQPPNAVGLDPTTAGTPTEEVDDQPLDPTVAFTATATTAESDRIDSPRPPETEATDDSVWKFVVDTPPAEEPPDTETAAPEFGEASGPKTAAKPDARPALPGVTPMEKLVDRDLESVSGDMPVTPPIDLERTTLPGGAIDPDVIGPGGEAKQANQAVRTDPTAVAADAIIAARFQRAYEGSGGGDPTSDEQRQPSPDPIAAASTSPADDQGASAPDLVSSASSPAPTVAYDVRQSMIATVASVGSGVIDATIETADPRGLGTTETPAPDTADRLVQSLRMQFLRGGGDAVVHIRPEHLGPLTVSVRVEHGVVSAHVTADNAVVAEWLQANEQMLRDSLKANGLILERLVIQRDEQSGSHSRRDPAHSQRHQRRRDLERQSTFDVTV